jgi:hypothetical protein
MPRVALYFPTGSQVPEPHGSVGAGSEDVSLVRREKHLMDSGHVTDESAQLPSGRHLPETGCSLVTAGEGEMAVA